MNIFKAIPIAILLVTSPLVVADSGKYCSYLMSFGLSNPDTKSKLEEYSLKDCKKGDVVHIHITDADNLGRVAMYMAGEISEICDNALPITIVSESRAVCTYRGSRRSIRREE